jgi:titin
LSWRDNSENEIGFEVERTANGVIKLLQQYADQTTLVDTGLKKNTWHYYRIRALGVAGPSPWTNKVRVRTLR